MFQMPTHFPRWSKDAIEFQDLMCQMQSWGLVESQALAVIKYLIDKWGFSATDGKKTWLEFLKILKIIDHKNKLNVSVEHYSNSSLLMV